MFYVRTTKTASSAIAVQVVRYENRNMVVSAHIGSAHTKEELNSLKKTAMEWIVKTSKQPQLLSYVRKKTSPNLVSLEKCQFLGFRYRFMYEVFVKLFVRFKFHQLHQSFLVDLAIMRIVEPTSKLRALELLKEYFGIKHLRKHFYEALPNLDDFKIKAETRTLDIARQEFSFDFSLVFYDVTTLYFESFEPDDLRKHGFSKDNKPGQPQIIIGLVVTKEGFPVTYQIFEGNKFEGHTLIPVITDFKKRHKIKTLTVVADAAMVSLENMRALKANNLSYIVGARIGNVPLHLMRTAIQKLNQIDKNTMRLQTAHGDLICDFSSKRYAKDKREMERQIKKAEILLREPSAMKRTKFLKSRGATKPELNTELIEKTKMLLGVKGYYTNLKIGNELVISHYHSLWRVEQAFRIAKNDLQMRPIYHFKKQAIEAHVLICFMALAICKYMELKTGRSTKKLIQLLKSVADGRILDTLTNREIIMRSPIPEGLKSILSRLNVPY